MTHVRLGAVVVLAMTAFAANSILCRLALSGTAIDPATFTLVRLVSGALVLAAIVRLRDTAAPTAGDWRSALNLFTYAAAFSYAYVTLSAGTGALLLFGAVQATMILTGLVRGDRLLPVQAAGLGLALAGLVALVLPGVTQPSWLGASLMVIAGIAWGFYSLRGRGNARPIGHHGRQFCAGLLAGLRACGSDAIATAVGFVRSCLRRALGRDRLRRGVRALVLGVAVPASDAGRNRAAQRAGVDGGGRGLPAGGDADAATRALFRGGAEWHRLDPHNALGCPTARLKNRADDSAHAMLSTERTREVVVKAQ